jgi:hypothetical protein
VISRPFLIAAARGGENMGRSRRRCLPLLVLVLAVAGCGPRAGTPPAPQARAWTFGPSPEHVALWYHGLAIARASVADEVGATVLPYFRPGYPETIVAAKEDAGVGATSLDERAAEFGQAFLAPAYDALQFLPLYFPDSPALFGSIRLWDQAGGNPRNVQAQGAAQVINFLSGLFPDTAQRRVVVQWAALLEEEARVFFRNHFERQFLRERQLARDVQASWQAVAPRLQPYLVSVNLHGGEAYLVPALGPEGRIVPRGAGDPRVALMSPPADAPAEGVLSFVHEIMYMLVTSLVEEHPQAEETGQRVLGALAAVRAGPLLLDEAVPELAEEYRRYHLRAAGRATPAVGIEAAFNEAFPLPGDLEQALRTAIRNTLAPPSG